ncbi:MAG: metallophosphoesterase [Clostridia bacterium]|nr:metallophosphoesterase [Clostridia bacterium]
MENSNKPLCIMSDFHSVYQAIWKVQDKIDEGYRVAILGDCIDRGAFGYKMLLQIYEEYQSGSNLIFIPGNHEAEMYSTLYYVYKRYEKILNKRELENGNRAFTEEDRQSIYDEILEIFEKVSADEDERGSTNGSSHTYFGIVYDIETYKGAAEKFIEVMDWLGSQPLLRIETDIDGKKIALCHASFDMGLYEDFGGQFSLETRLALKEKMKSNSKERNFYESYYERARTCLWYRTDLEKRLVPVRLPTEEEADQIVIGHVSQPNNEIEVKTLKGIRKRKRI